MQGTLFEIGEPKTPVTHLTLCGPMAGIPICGVKRSEAAKQGCLFAHAMWTNLDATPNVCPECRAMWESED